MGRRAKLSNIRQRLNRITKIPKEYRKKAPPIPPSVKIELSPRCNYNCEPNLKETKALLYR